MNHRPADRLCVDLGAGGQTGIGVCAAHRLRRALLGDPDYRVRVSEPYQMLGEVDEALRKALRLDVAGVPGPGSMFGFSCDDYKPFVMPDGTPCRVPGRFNWTEESDGAILMYPEGDTSVPASAKMPSESFFFDAIDRQGPIDEAALDPADNCEEFGPLSDADLEVYARNARHLADDTDYGLYMTLPGTDFGHQTGQFCSVQTYRDLYKPYHRAVNDRIHERTRWKTFIHSCGAVYPLIPEFIDAGFDVLNPVQCSAADMEPRRLKREFGRDVVFWGGGVDTQKTLPFGTPDEVYREVRERIETFFEDRTGFVFNTIHNIQSNVPVENILAMFRAVDDARGV